MDKTFLAIEKATLSEDLANPGFCRYVNSNGTRCIVGTVLHNIGVDDEQLQNGINLHNGNMIDDANDETISQRLDLSKIITDNGLNVKILADAQNLFDGYSNPFNHKAFLKDLLKIIT